jgi:glycosyltransferase involved in cell wall biosynthesis
MRVSVAMATYNGERFLPEQLESIAWQARPPDELVVSDDGSSDRTLEITREFADRSGFDVIILRNDVRLGAVGNFFRAMSSCTGDLIAFSDQDDVWHPEKLERCERQFGDSRVSLVIHSARTVNETLHPIWSHPRDHIRRHKRYPPGSLRPFPHVRAGMTMMFRATFVNRADIARRPRFLSGDLMSHDYWVNFICGALGDLVLLPDELALFRRHPGTATESWSGHLTDPRRTSPRLLRSSQDTHRRLQEALALHTDNQEYLSRSSAARERQAYLEQLRPLAAALGAAASAGLEHTIEAHRRYAEALERRAWTYAERRAPARAGRVIRHMLVGDYGARLYGGLGAASLLRDLTIGLTARASTTEGWAR